MLNETALQHFTKAEHLLKAGEIDKSVLELRIALSIDPNYAEARYNLGVLLEREGRNNEALTEYKRVTHDAPHLAQAHLNLGALMVKIRQYGKAIATYQAALQVCPDSAELHYNLANVLDHQGMLDEAIAEYSNAVQLRPSLIQAFNNLGRTALRNNDWLGAIDAYEEVVRLDCNWETAYFGLGCAYAKIGRNEDAIGAFKSRLQLAPKDADALLELSRCLLIQAIEEKSKESVRLAQAALKSAYALQPYNIQVYKTMLEARRISQKL